MDITTQALFSNLQDDLSAQVDWSRINSGIKISDLSDVKEAAALSISRALLKKFRPESSEKLDSVALLKFLTVNKKVRDWRLHAPTDTDKILLGELKRAVYEFWCPGGLPLVSNPMTCLDFGRCGPGSSIYGIGGDEYTKMYASPLTCTSSILYSFYRRYVSEDQNMEEAEKLRFSEFGGPNIVDGSRLTFVPKNDKTSRCICVEPTLNMFYQLGLGRILELRLRSHFGIDMATQQFKNRELARLGSINDDLCTIDLESASDSLGLHMLKEVLPKDLFEILSLLRSPICHLPGVGPFELDMISTMGNGFTFPLQTMLFSSVVIASFRTAGVKPYYPRGTSHGNWGVFGDDIIVPSLILDNVLRLLDILGFVTNSDKTFVKGPFRESCGEDFFLGVNIRGVYIKSVKTPQERYAAINQLNLFSTRTGIFLRNTVSYLRESVKFLPVPMFENEDSGIRVPVSLARDLPRCKDTQAYKYVCYVSKPKRIFIREDRFVFPKNSKRRLYNPYGLYVSFLRRSVRSMSIAVRHDRSRYTHEVRTASNWNQPPATHPLSGWFPWKRCESVFYFNLFG